MKLHAASLFLLALCLTSAAIPVMGSTLYENGPVNGTTDAWAFSGGFENTQSFTAIEPPGGNITSFNGWFWIVPGDSITGVQLSIGTAPFGSDVFNINLGAPILTSNCFTNQYGYNVCDEEWTFSGPSVNGNYWLTLQNGTTAFGTQPFWDKNSGIGCTSPGCPSTAELNQGIGTIPSEAFTISGVAVPEPSSILLMGSGILGLAGVLRRKVFWLLAQDHEYPKPGREAPA